MKIVVHRSFDRLVLAATLISCTPSPVFAEPKQIVIHDAPTNEDMMVQRRKAQAERASGPITSAAVSQDSSKMDKPVDLIGNSIILSYCGAAALVPKGAIIEYSEKYKDRLKKSPGDKLVEFSEFVTANRSWLATHEVSFVQAQGKVLVDKNAKAQMKKNGNIVVATFRGNPIEMMPPLPSAKDPSKIPSQSNKSQP